MKKMIVLLAWMLGTSAALFANGDSSDNVVLNPSFEDGRKNWGHIISAGKFNFSIDSTVARSGKSAAKMECTAIDPKADGTWKHPKGWARWVQKVTVKPNTKYRFRCFARSLKDGKGKVTIFLIGNVKPGTIGFTEELDGERWIEVRNDTFVAKGDTAIIYLNYYGEGTVWIDDVEMTEIK